MVLLDGKPSASVPVPHVYTAPDDDRATLWCRPALTCTTRTANEEDEEDEEDDEA